MRRNEAHWLLTDADAKKYGLALSNAMRHLPVQVAQKYLDFSTLAFCVFEMESPRVLRSRQLAAQKARGPVPPGGATVFTFTPPPGSPNTTAARGNGQAPQPAAPVEPFDLGMTFEPETFGP